MNFPIRTPLALLCLIPALAAAQNPIPLNFSQSVEGTNAIYPNNSTLGPEYFSGSTYHFLNVATQNGKSVDARLTVTATQGNYEFVGWLPNYSTDTPQPNGDLGVYYRHNGFFPNIDPLNPMAERFSSGGISFRIEFYEGGGSFVNNKTLSKVAFLIYDFDGEPFQSESIRTYETDGFSGYKIYDNSGIVANGSNGEWTFNSAGINMSETGPEGSFIAYYRNTSSIRFDMFSTTSTNNPMGNNGIFAAWDGDLSLVGPNTPGYSPLTVVPEPSSLLMVTAAASLALVRRRRQGR